MRHVIVAGGGNAEDSAPADDVFARSIHTHQSILYLPIALDPHRHPYATCLAWLRSVFGPRGLHNISMWSDITGKTDEDVAPYAAVYIGGGNTFTLLHMFQSTGFLHVLRRFIERGGIVYGGSAGAIMLGRDIRTAAHMDPNDVRVTDSAGLNVLSGHAIWCHYQPADDMHIRAYVGQCGFPVIALSERAAVSARADQIVALGYDPTLVFDTQTRQVYGPSALITL